MLGEPAHAQMSRCASRMTAASQRVAGYSETTDAGPGLKSLTIDLLWNLPTRTNTGKWSGSATQRPEIRIMKKRKLGKSNLGSRSLLRAAVELSCGCCRYRERTFR